LVENDSNSEVERFSSAEDGTNQTEIRLISGGAIEFKKPKILESAINLELLEINKRIMSRVSGVKRI